MKPTLKLTDSLRKLFFVIMTFAMTSIVINYQSVPYSDKNGSDVMVLEQNVAIKRLAEVVDIRGFGRSLNQHSDAHIQEADRDIKQKLLLKLTQIENELHQNANSPVIALGNSKRDRDSLASVTLKGQRLQVVQAEEDLEKLGLTKWSIMFCSNQSSCPTHDVKLEQKVDVIQSLQKFVDNPRALCKIARDLHGNDGYASIENNNITVNLGNVAPCCITDASTKRDKGVGSSNGSQLINDTKCTNMYDKTDVHWHLPNDPIIFESGPLLRLQTLVTSLFPIRLYIGLQIHSGPFKGSEDSRYFKKSTFGNALQHISEKYGLQMSSLWWDTLRTTLIKYFFRIESELESPKRRCTRCFQVLDIDVTCHSLLQCGVIKLSKRERLTTDYINSVLSITDSRYNVADFVTKALGSILAYLPIKLCEDDTYTTGCLSSDDLAYMLDDRRERLKTSNWIKIYPSSEGHLMSQSLHRRSSMNTYLNNIYHMYDVLTELQKYYTNTDRGDQEFLYRERFHREWTTFHMKQQENKRSGEKSRYKECSNDDKDYGVVGDIKTSPELTLDKHSPSEYFANVSYDTISITLWAESKHCQCKLRIESKYNPHGPRNITLGLGETVVHIYTVDSRLRELTIVGVTILSFFRRARGIQSHNLNNNESFRACGFKQDCAFPFLKTEKCGLHDIDMTWSSYKALVMPRCQDGDSPGQWVVPCRRCAVSSSCKWHSSVWQPFQCSYHQPTIYSIKQCLKGRKLMFIGDSTNRGVMNYIIEKTNGSLWDWDKTHSLKVYTNVNQNNTTFSFAYYPHFWLPVDHRPTFHKLIYQLIKSSMPYDNNKNTVLVVGGVQWLAKQHIDFIIQALQKKGLTNITMVVKGIGAGFHQPVEGVRFISSIEQAGLAERETEILSYAKTRGFKIVSTFNMTMSRYKDFLEGKCACHFHKVKNIQPRDNSQPGRQYTVEGEINAAYSDIVIDQICH